MYIEDIFSKYNSFLVFQDFFNSSKAEELMLKHFTAETCKEFILEKLNSFKKEIIVVDVDQDLQNDSVFKKSFPRKKP